MLAGRILLAILVGSQKILAPRFFTSRIFRNYITGAGFGASRRWFIHLTTVGKPVHAPVCFGMKFGSIEVAFADVASSMAAAQVMSRVFISAPVKFTITRSARYDQRRDDDRSGDPGHQMLFRGWS